MIHKITTALISVSDKTGIVDFAQTLSEHGVTLLSTGGTAKILRDHGLMVTDVADYTQFPEIMDGRVKTLHPKIYGGLLARAEIDDAVLAEHAILSIDLVVVNLYPFAKTTSQPNCTLADAIENIDIGGPCMLRAAAKNHQRVTVVVDPNDYQIVLAEMRVHQGNTQLATRLQFAQKVFAHTSQYDQLISQYLTAQTNKKKMQFPSQLNLSFTKQEDLRYGENPHQSAAFYVEQPLVSNSIAVSRQHQGKALSYNNIADTDAALECVKQFNDCACVIVKHANPCGVAIAKTQKEAYLRAYQTDSTSAFGGIIAFNYELDGETARLIIDQQFVEVIIAPAMHTDALTIVAEKKNVRLLSYQNHLDTANNQSEFDYKRVNGGLLVQTWDNKHLSQNDLKIVTKKSPDALMLKDLLFAWKVVKMVKSNAIVYVKDQATIGIGAVQMSRVFSSKLAQLKAQDAKLAVKGSVMASDAFFPFRDTIDQAAEAGITAIIQPGGSMRDAQVIQAANEAGIAMVFTGIRHFKHA